VQKILFYVHYSLHINAIALYLPYPFAIQNGCKYQSENMVTVHPPLNLQVTWLAINIVRSVSPHLFASMWHALVSVITTLSYVAIIVSDCQVWYRVMHN